MEHNRLTLSPGTVIAVWIGPIQHVGVVSDRMYGLHSSVISNSHRAGRVIEEPLPVFAGGRPVHVVGYLGNLSPQQVLQRARSRIGEAWDLLRWNCEHFVRWAHDTRPYSPQLITGAALLAAIALLVASGNKKG